MSYAEVNEDGRIGLAEAIFVIQELLGLRWGQKKAEFVVQRVVPRKRGIVLASKIKGLRI